MGLELKLELYELELNINFRLFWKPVILFFFFFFCLLSFVFLGPHLRHMGVPRLGVESELQLLAYTEATGTQDPSCVCDLHHSSWQHRILTH